MVGLTRLQSCFFWDYVLDVLFIICIVGSVYCNVYFRDVILEGIPGDHNALFGQPSSAQPVP